MFDIGFWELCLIAVVALIVLGPERLPGAARTAGLWIGKARKMISSVKDEIDRELQLDEVRKRLKEGEATLRENTGIGDLEMLASNSITDLEKFEKDVTTDPDFNEVEDSPSNDDTTNVSTDPKSQP